MLISNSMRYLYAFLVLVLASVACSLGASPEPTEIPATKTPLPTSTPNPTSTPKPTSTPRPTETPDVVATEMSELESEMSVLVQGYHDEGYLPSADGEYIPLADFEEDWAQIDWYRWWTFDLTASTFVMSGHFNWSSAVDYPAISGCGFAFDVSENSAYAVFVDKDRILFLNGKGYEVGKTRGSGRVSFSLPAEIDFTLIVNSEEHKAFALVDGEFIGEYAISQNENISGAVGYSILSGTNRDFGTHCEITNASLWVTE